VTSTKYEPPHYAVPASWYVLSLGLYILIIILLSKSLASRDSNVLTAELLKIQDFCDAVPCSMVHSVVAEVSKNGNAVTFGDKQFNDT
jgi:prepilin signal peptidase PulO-like enzyme (type II secretory pathway)